MEQYSYNCPNCLKDYELCRRYLSREDDGEYSLAPRVLKCLHTCCNSCLEDMVQKNANGSLICPLCKENSDVKGVRYLPFDGCAMMEAALTDTTSMMQYCSRCHDEVQSFSWCFQCCTSLCEFHHNDHKRSINTSHHYVDTINHILASNINIPPHLPQIPCPDILGEYCTLYCQTCKHLVSAQSMILYHKQHAVVDIDNQKTVSMELLSDTIGNFTDMKDQMFESITNIKENMKRLDSVVNSTAASIVEEMERMRNLINDRENSLLLRLETIANEKRLLLTHQLNEISDLYDDCSASISFNRNVVNTLPEEQRGDYLVATEAFITSKCESIQDKLSKLRLDPVTNTTVSSTFDTVNIELLCNIIAQLGAVHVHDLNSLNDLYTRSVVPLVGERKYQIPAKTVEVPVQQLSNDDNKIAHFTVRMR